MENFTLYHKKSDNPFTKNFAEIEIDYSKSYLISTAAIGYWGEENSAYFVIIEMDKNKNEIKREIIALNDFSENLRLYTKEITPLTQSHSIVYGYRINTETATQSDIKLHLLNLDKITFYPKIV